MADLSLEQAVDAIEASDAAALERLLDAHAGLAAARVRDDRGSARTLLHVVTDWPGNRAGAARMIRTLVDRGADPNARFGGHPARETPLHWAASSDDLAALDALLDAGADIEATGAVIGGGTPIADAVAFGQWKAARRLVERGAATALWQAAALGLMDRVRGHFAGTHRSLPWTPRPPRPGAPAPDEVTHAFWSACHGGQREAAEFLLGKGPAINWVGYDGLTALEAAERSGAAELAAWLQSVGARRAAEIG